MDELFRFVALRPPLPSSDPIVLDDQSPLAVSLANARRAKDAREAMNRLAQAFVRSDDFVQDPSTLNLPLDRLADALEEADDSDWSAADLVERTLGAPAARIAESPEFAADVARLQDTMLAIKLAPAEDADGAAVVRLLEAADAVRGIASDRVDAGVTTKRLFLMPASIFPLPAVTVKAAPPAPPDPAAEEHARDLEERAAAIVEALESVTALAQALAATPPDSALGLGAEPHEPEERSKRGTAGSEPRSSAGALTLDKAAVARLPENVRDTLADLGIDPLTTTVPALLQTLRTELGRTERMIR